LISIIDVVGINGRPSQEATVATAEGNKRFYLTTDLQQKLSSVPIGNEVKIEFMGEVRTMRGTMMKNFKVKSHKPKAVDSIDSML
jgi:hypothetical protein